MATEIPYADVQVGVDNSESAEQMRSSLDAAYPTHTLYVDVEERSQRKLVTFRHPFIPGDLACGKAKWKHEHNIDKQSITIEALKPKKCRQNHVMNLDPPEPQTYTLTVDTTTTVVPEGYVTTTTTVKSLSKSTVSTTTISVKPTGRARREVSRRGKPSMTDVWMKDPFTGDATCFNCVSKSRSFKKWECWSQPHWACSPNGNPPPVTTTVTGVTGRCSPSTRLERDAYMQQMLLRQDTSRQPGPPRDPIQTLKSEVLM